MARLGWLRWHCCWRESLPRRRAGPHRRQCGDAGRGRVRVQRPGAKRSASTRRAMRAASRRAGGNVRIEGIYFDPAFGCPASSTIRPASRSACRRRAIRSPRRAGSSTKSAPPWRQAGRLDPDQRRQLQFLWGGDRRIAADQQAAVGRLWRDRRPHRLPRRHRQFQSQPGADRPLAPAPVWRSCRSGRSTTIIMTRRDRSMCPRASICPQSPRRTASTGRNGPISAIPGPIAACSLLCAGARLAAPGRRVPVGVRHEEGLRQSAGRPAARRDGGPAAHRRSAREERVAERRSPADAQHRRRTAAARYSTSACASASAAPVRRVGRGRPRSDADRHRGGFAQARISCSARSRATASIRRRSGWRMTGGGRTSARSASACRAPITARPRPPGPRADRVAVDPVALQRHRRGLCVEGDHALCRLCPRARGKRRRAAQRRQPQPAARRGADRAEGCRSALERDRERQG